MAHRNKQHISNGKKSRMVEFDEDSGDERDAYNQQQSDTIQFLIGLLEKVAKLQMTTIYSSL